MQTGLVIAALRLSVMCSPMLLERMATLQGTLWFRQAEWETYNAGPLSTTNEWGAFLAEVSPPQPLQLRLIDGQVCCANYEIS